MKHLFLVILFAFFFVGCDSENSNSFDDWMTCPVDKSETTADLAWIDFDATCNYNPLPGDTILLNIQVRNNNPNHDTPDIPKSSVLRVFMENVDADLSTIGTIGPEDWFIGEFVIPALLEDERYSTLEVVEIPLTSSFLTELSEGSTNSAGVINSSFKIYGFLDAQNCIVEIDETNNVREATINGAAGEINITTPILPNLQIRYIQKFLNKTITQNGGYVVTEWEIFNRGFNPVNEDFNVSIFLSEDDSYDVWDAKLVEKRVTDDIAGYSSIIVAIIVKMPYVTWRNNGWSLFSAYEKYDPVKGDEMYTRELPPNGPPGYMFCVYPCIESTSKLIALVDSRGTNEVLESIETDNYSFMGPGGNGELKAETNPTGFKDIELLDFRVANYIFSPGGNTANVYDISIRYSASIQYADYCSFAFYWSKDDKAHFGDYFIQRYWFQIQPGHDILLYPFGINYVWKPDPLPPAGTYRMVMVMDDIFKFAESDESNNAKVSRGTVTVN